MTRRLCESVIERPLRAASDVGEDAVENLAMRFVFVEAEIEKVPEESSALGRAERVRAFDGRGVRVVAPG